MISNSQYNYPSILRSSEYQSRTSSTWWLVENPTGVCFYLKNYLFFWWTFFFLINIDEFSQTNGFLLYELHTMKCTGGLRTGDSKYSKYHLFIYYFFFFENIIDRICNKLSRCTKRAGIRWQCIGIHCI